MGLRGTTLLAWAALSTAVLGTGAPAARADTFKDEKLGYSLNVPARWITAPMDPGGWLVARFNSNREYEWNDARNNDWTYHKPYIEVVVIPYAVKDSKGVTVEKTDEGTKISRTVPWKDLKEYMDKTYQDRQIGGFHFSGEEAATVGGVKVRRLEITVDKLVRGERRIYGWEFAGEDAYYGLVSEILATKEKDLRPDIFQAFSSFKLFPRSGKLPGTATPGEEVIVRDPKKEAAKELTPEEMKKKRDDASARVLSRLKEGLPKDWGVVEGKNFTAVSHADAKYTREVLAHAEALRAWLESEFGFVGGGYAGRTIIRIFADNQEYSAYSQNRRWTWGAPEVTTYKDKEGWDFAWNMNSLNREIYDIWLRDKNEQLSWGLPMWLMFGLPNYLERAKCKGGRLEFKAGTWDSVEMKNIRRSDNLMPVVNFFRMTSDELWKQEGAPLQTQFFVNFLLAGAASKSPKYRNILTDYLKNLIFLLDAEEPAKEEAARVPQNEKEEEEMNRGAQDSWRKRERETLDKLFEKTFGTWGDRDWDAFNALYRQDLK